jgi:hypothetical protein
MMELLRDTFTDTATIGELYFDGDLLCDTLEDRVRVGEDGTMQEVEKIFGQTAIPVGMYEVVLLHWDRYGCKMPTLLNVPYFSGIFIHPGNTDRDTLGCVLVGDRQANTPDRVINSRVTFFEKVLPRIHDYLDMKHPLFIDVRNA